MHICEALECDIMFEPIHTSFLLYHLSHKDFLNMYLGIWNIYTQLT